MARLVPAKCPTCGAGLRLDPALDIVTCEYCGTSSFVRTEKRPPPPQVLEARQPVIWVESPKPLSGAAIGLIVAAILGALALAAFSYTHGRRAAGATPAASATRPPPPSASAPPPKPSPTFFEEAKHARWILEQHLGSPLRLHQLTFYDRSLVVYAQDTKQPRHIDRYHWSSGAFDRPTPAPIDRATVERKLFNLADLDFSLIPRIVEDALQTAKLERGQVSHIIAQRPLPFRKEVVWRVYVRDERDAESYEYSLKGKRLK